MRRNDRRRLRARSSISPCTAAPFLSHGAHGTAAVSAPAATRRRVSERISELMTLHYRSCPSWRLPQAPLKKIVEKTGAGVALVATPALRSRLTADQPAKQ